MADNIKYSKACWLLKNTLITFQQIADFCEIDIREVAAIENGESIMMSSDSIGYDLIVSNELSAEEINRCEQDIDAVLQYQKDAMGGISKRKQKK